MKMKIKILMLLIIGLPISVDTYSQVNNKAFGWMINTLLEHNVPEISIARLEKFNNPVLLDSRSKTEYEVSHLEDAIWVGYEDFDIVRMKNICESDTIVVYCSVGYRSEKITYNLKQLGYNNVYNLYGGIFEWVNNDLPVYDKNGKTCAIHPYDKKWGVWLEKGCKKYKPE